MAQQIQGGTWLLACDDMNSHQEGRLKRDVYLSAMIVQHIE